MHVRSTAAGWSVYAPAKLNLFLEVLGKRADGFHEIETVIVPISLYDTVDFQSTESDQIELTCESAVGGTTGESQLAALPSAAENLVTLAVRLLRERAGVTWGAT